LKLFTKIKPVFQKLEVNRAVSYNLLALSWSALSAPLAMLVIAYWLSAEEQGFYYTFSSVLALQVFVELGLATVIVQVASHEWAFLKREVDGRITGRAQSLSRLASLTRFALTWYILAGLAIMAGLSIGGYFFFLSKPHPEITWQIPWFGLCFVAGLALMMSPLFSVIEGCNQVASIYSFRFVQGVLSTLAVVVSMLVGLGLYSLMISALTRFITGIFFLGLKHYNFVQQLLRHKIQERIDWFREVWPFQWRIAASWLSGYFIFSLFTPVMFYYHGAKVAGQMGMTWSVISMVEMVSFAWITARIPQFGILIARRQYRELDRLFAKLFKIAVGIAALCALGAWLVIYLLHLSDLELGRRFLPMLPVTLFLIHRVFNVMISGMAVYLRAHKKEPMMIPSLVGAALAGTSTWLLGASYGPTGAAAGFLAIGIIWGIPSAYYVFSTNRKRWHHSDLKSDLNNTGNEIYSAKIIN